MWNSLGADEDVNKPTKPTTSETFCFRDSPVADEDVKEPNEPGDFLSTA